MELKFFCFYYNSCISVLYFNTKKYVKKGPPGCHITHRSLSTSIPLTLAWLLTVRAAAIEGHPADPTVFIIGYPQPGGHSVPLSDLYLHPPCLTRAERHSTIHSLRNQSS